MNKAVLISIQPKWVELIASGKKTIEVRKTCPQIETPFKCYIYCTAIKDKKRYTDEFDIPIETGMWKGNSHIIGEFVCDKILTLDNEQALEANEYGAHSIWDVDLQKWDDWMIDEACLSTSELADYLKGGSASFWHISDLKIYDTPKKLSEFRKPCADSYDPMYGSYCVDCDKRCKITRPPQSYVYVEELTDGKDN